MIAKKSILISALAVMLCTLAAESQTRRFSRPRTRADRQPFISPYLNLLNSGGNFETQYFQRTLPELDFRRNKSMLDSQLMGLQHQVTSQGQLLQNVQTTLGGTGHQTSFLNTGGYFSSSGARSSGGSSFGRSSFGRSNSGRSSGGLSNSGLSGIGNSNLGLSNVGRSTGGRSSRR